MVGICLVIIILGVAFAVDTGRTALTAAESRTIADLAALDAARSLDGVRAGPARQRRSHPLGGDRNRQGLDRLYRRGDPLGRARGPGGRGPALNHQPPGRLLGEEGGKAAQGFLQAGAPGGSAE